MSGFAGWISAQADVARGTDRYLLFAAVRLDAREDLADVLARAGQRVSRASSDEALIFAAWLHWREDCVQHLRGDFSFAVVDQETNRLFAARDHFGVRPFYYTATHDRIDFANTQAALRAVPGVAADNNLDERAIVDLLVFRYIDDAAATAFASIRRLPPGSTMTWQAGKLTIASYWTGPLERPIRFARDTEYLDGFLEVFGRAVGDRISGSSVAVTMTGGLDSSSIAVTAAALHRTGQRSASVHPYTIVYDTLIPDRERHFAGLVANHAGLPITFTAADDYALHDRARDSDLQAPEPLHNPFRAMHADYYRAMARDHRVMLMGLDGDSLLSEVASDYLLALVRRGRMGEYTRGVAAYIRTRGELPPHRLRSGLARMFARAPQDHDSVPRWLHPEARQRWDVDARFQNRPARRRGLVPGWPLRPRATSVMGTTKWRAMFDRHDTEYLGAPIEARFPFADLRVVEYLLNIPAIPWCIDKYIVRQAMKDALPPEVLTRPKALLAGDTVAARVARGDRTPWAHGFDPHPQLDAFVDVSVLRARDSLDPEVDTRALVLNEWLWYHLPRS